MLRLMRDAGLLAPQRPGRDRGPWVHDGTIITEAPDLMWATDATTTWLPGSGQVTVFAVVDHCTNECLGLHAGRPGTRFEALEPLRQAVRRVFGGFREGITRGLALRHDHGSQYVSDAFQGEIRFLGMVSSPALIYTPEGNGVVERFFRTLKEQFLWCHAARTLEQLNEQLQQWRHRYNQQWLIQHHGPRPEWVQEQLRWEVKALTERAEAADRDEAADGMDIPAEIARREQRLAAIAEAKAKIEVRGADRDDAEREAYEAKQADREAQRQAGIPPRGREPKPAGPRGSDQVNLTDEHSRIMPVGGSVGASSSAITPRQRSMRIFMKLA